MDLKKRAMVLYYAITALFLIPGVVLALLALICYNIPPKRIFQDRVGESIARLVAKMIVWRRFTVIEWYEYRRDGYKLIVK